MSSPDDYDDYDDRPKRPVVPFPPGIRAAGIIWIGFGILGLIGAGLSFALNAAAAAANAGQPVGGNVCGSACIALFALSFLLIGVQTVKGTAKGTLGNGIGSLIFGLLYAAIAVIAIIAGARFAGGPQGLPIVVTTIYAMLAMALLTAGLLAVVGRQAYAEWRVMHGFSTRARPRTAEEKDYDDRPRPPRREVEKDDQE
jgi:hypothetical protein